MKIYFAAPLFTHAERNWNQQLADTLLKEAPNIQMFLPQVDADVFLADGQIDLSSVYSRCIQGVDEADVLVAVLDGADVDSGTAFECGYAFAKGKPIIGIRTDIREGEDQGMNLMLCRSLKKLITLPANTGGSRNISDLAHQIIQAIADVTSQSQL